MLFLIVIMMFSALSCAFDCYDVDFRLISALGFVFGGYNDDYRALFCFLLLR